MKTKIIDNSLCDSFFTSYTTAEDIDMYIKSLYKLGVGYIEMTADSFLKLSPQADCKKIILRITDKRDIHFINNFDFAFVVVPNGLLYMADKINLPIIAEICPAGGNIFSAINGLLSSDYGKAVSVVRIVDDFLVNFDEMAEINQRLKAHYTQSFDFCPTNNHLTAVSTAIEAVSTKADSVTMCFGSGEIYAELVDYYKGICATFGFIPSAEGMVAILSCELLYYKLYGREAGHLFISSDNSSGNILPMRAFNADEVFLQNRSIPPYFYPQNDKTEKQKHDLIYDMLRSMQITQMEAEEIKKAIEEFVLPLYKS